MAQSTDTVDVDYILKQNHHYYTQVQHQMYGTGALYTDFVVYLPKESAVVRVKRDDCFANISIPQLKQFSMILLFLKCLRKQYTISGYARTRLTA